MNLRFIAYSVGTLLQMLALAMVVPAGIAWTETAGAFTERAFDPRFFGFLLAIAGALGVGTALTANRRLNEKRNAVREGFAIVTFGWLVLTFFGCIPLMTWFMYHSGPVTVRTVLHCFTDAYFEIMSGFTTTGATILTDIEVLPRGILFWRSMTHWLGGMGIVTLVLAIFPAFGVTAYQMFRGEVPGPTTERLKPRLDQTAKILWGVYALLTGAETVFLRAAGMSWFEALCHAFGTMATGGFSTRNASLAAFNSDAIDWIVILFMFFAGMNFMIHYRVIFHRDFSLVRADREFRFYGIIVGGAIVLSTVVLLLQGLGERHDIERSFRHNQLETGQLTERMHVETEKVNTLYGAFRYSAFQVISLVTTTGFCTADFDMWPGVLRLVLVILMFFGGCAGSTGGGIKMIRILVVLKTAWREIRTMIQPRQVLTVKIAETSLQEKQVNNIIGFFVLFIILTVMFSIIMSFFVPDFTTAFTSVVATLCNIGPGLSGVGATENYAWIPLGGKWVLNVCMLLGRLEIFTVLIAVSPHSWRE